MARGYTQKIKAFGEIESFDFTQQLSEKIKNEIEEKRKEYILGVDEEEFKNYLIEKYSLEFLVIDFTSEKIEEPTISKEWVEDRYFRESYQEEIYNFTIKYNFTGSAELFKVKPSERVMTTTEILVNADLMTVSLYFGLRKKDPKIFTSLKAEHHNRAFSNLNYINKDVEQWNNSLREIVSSLFQRQKNKFIQENNFFASINIKVDKETTSIFSTPTIKKKVIPQPPVSKNKEFSSEPTMSREMYDDILKVIYDLGKSMEKKPSTYQKKDEEGLRDVFLLVLETRYEGTTASGETFNRGGKTDIILKYSKDNSNLFVAECKFWHGSVEFFRAISQLFDRYLTWRDSKTALLIFAKNKDFSGVLETIKVETKNHPYFVKENGNRGETSFSYIFHLPQDQNKLVYFEIIAFHFDS